MHKDTVIGQFKEDSEGRKVLHSVKGNQEIKEYVIREGTYGIDKNAFAECPFLTTIYIPASLREIPDGCLSVGNGWASTEKGITKIIVSPDNPVFTVSDQMFVRILPQNRFHLILALTTQRTAVIKKQIASVGEGAFFGRDLETVLMEDGNHTIRFPISHKYYLERLLGLFGKNGKIYDFTEYDRFLLQDRFNPERIRMLTERLKDPYDMQEGMLQKLREHASAGMTDMMEAVIAAGDTELLDRIGSAGLFTKENFSELTEQTGRSDRKDLMFWMMEYKNRHFGADETDFTI